MPETGPGAATRPILEVFMGLDDFRSGDGVFVSEAEFLEYWRGYNRTEQERRSSYSDIREFRAAKIDKV